MAYRFFKLKIYNFLVKRKHIIRYYIIISAYYIPLTPATLNCAIYGFQCKMWNLQSMITKYLLGQNTNMKQ